MNNTLRKNIDWVGYVDWTVRDFHSYITSRGATYNAYLVQDQKTALIDTVKAPYADYLVRNVTALTKPEKVDYIIVNHAELDHAGSVARAVREFTNATVVCNRKCEAILSSYNDTSRWNFQIVKTGDSINLGKRILTFIETPMVHWPESMFTYIPGEKLLFSMDAFGQHYASNNRFDDEVSMCEVMQEAKTYYANIVMLYGKQIKKTLEAASGLDIEMIAPAHGIIWRSHISEIIEAYRCWVDCRPTPKVLVLFDSMWESTRKMAESIVDGASLPGVEVKLISARATGMTDIATEVLDAACIAFGSATLNMGMMPMMAAILTYIKGLRPAGKSAFAFGSSGWGKGGAEAVHEFLQSMNMEVVREPIKCKWRPDADTLADCRAAGAALGELAKASGAGK